MTPIYKILASGPWTIICLHHHKFYFDKYSHLKKFCCNPLKTYAYAKTDLLELTLEKSTGCVI